MRRATARVAHDFVEADELRDRIAEAGWTVLDGPDGWSLEPLEPAEADEPVPVRAADVASVLDQPATVGYSIHWLCEGWPEDIARGLASFRAQQGEHTIQYVVADITGIARDAFGEDVEVVALEPDTGWAAARNAGLVRSTGELVVVMDGSIEVTGDPFSPLRATLSDPEVGIAGPFGIVTRDLREFQEAQGSGPCDAIEGYCLAMRREVLIDVGMFDEKFRWYRTADIELSFRVKERGLRTDVVVLPLVKHEHRMWSHTAAAERDRLSKRNYYRFLDRWRDRWDLVLDPDPPR